MANSYILYNGTGALTDFTVPFGYIQKAHVTLEVSGASVPFTWLSTTVVRATTAPVVGAANVKVKRATPRTALVTFSDGSGLTAADLNLQGTQSRYIAEEQEDAYLSGGLTNLSVATGNLQDGAVTLAKLANLATRTLIGRTTGTTGVPEAVSFDDVRILSDGSVTLRDLSARFADVLNVKDYGAVGDGINDDTSSIQAAITATQTAGGGTVFLPRGVYKLSSTLVISQTGVKILGAARSGPTFGIVSTNGSVLRYDATTGDALRVVSTGLAANTGLAVVLEDFTVIGNADFAGAVSGGGIKLQGDTAAEANFIEGSQFRNIIVRRAKGNGWSISGTVFLNNFVGCVGGYCGGSGLEIDPGAGGRPTQNVFSLCLFTDAGAWGVLLKTGNRKETFTGCSVAQNTSGGIFQTGGFTTITDVDFEANVGPAISLVSSSAATRITGGMIHKTPASASRTGISVGSGCASIQVDGTLFANYDHANDRVLAFSGGGTMALFNYRFQNTPATAFPTSLWSSIALIPPKEKTLQGTVTFTGSGIGSRGQTVTFSSAFELSYTILFVTDVAGGIDPLKAVIGVNYGSQALGTITAYMTVNDATYGSVPGRYIAIGR